MRRELGFIKTGQSIDGSNIPLPAVKRKDVIYFDLDEGQILLEDVVFGSGGGTSTLGTTLSEFNIHLDSVVANVVYTITRITSILKLNQTGAFAKLYPYLWIDVLSPTMEKLDTFRITDTLTGDLIASYATKIQAYTSTKSYANGWVKLRFYLRHEKHNFRAVGYNKFVTLLTGSNRLRTTRKQCDPGNTESQTLAKLIVQDFWGFTPTSTGITNFLSACIFRTKFRYFSIPFYQGGQVYLS